MAVSVAVAVGGTAEPLIERLKPRIESLKIGPYTDADAGYGADRQRGGAEQD